MFIEGQKIVEACWDLGEAAFLLSGGACLHVFSRDGYADWQISDATAYVTLRERLASRRWTVVVNYVTATGERKRNLTERAFSLGELLDKYAGKAVWRIAVAHTSLYLQFRGTGGWQMFFFPVKRHDNGEPLLVWAEEFE